MKQIWKQRYQILDNIGQGGNGEVYRVWDLHLEKEWAMKILEDNYPVRHEKGKEQKIEEWQVLKKINHPYFPRIVDAFEEENSKILIMDYIQGVTLEKILEKGPLEESKIWSLAQQIAEAILYLHQQTPTLLYMDLKPSNIIVEENGGIKLVDLGSVIIKGCRADISGSLGFASPEQRKVRNEGRYLQEQSDIFSFGLVLYVMATGNIHRIPLIEDKSRRGVWVRKENPVISSYLEKIIEKCTRGNMEKRYSGMREVKKDLETGSYGFKKKGNRSFFPLYDRKRETRQWYQEKSIFCTEGRHSFYIAKKIFVLCLLLLTMLPGKVIFAGEKTESLLEDQFKVKIRDNCLRKVLLKKNCAYETSENLILEIPWEEIVGERYKIWVECEDESKEKKIFSMECIYKK